MSSTARSGPRRAAALAARHAAALLPVGLAALVYLHTVEGYFNLDDFLHLYQIVDHGPLRFALNPHGGHLLVTSNLAFTLCHRVFGLNAQGYQWVAYLTHLFNVALLYWLIARLTERRLLAAFGASLWGACPTALGSLPWFSVYGHLLATTAILLVLCDMARLCGRDGPVGSFAVARWIALLLAASTSFGIGLGAALPFGAVAYLLLPRAADRARAAAALGALLVALPALFALLHWIHARIAGEAAVDAGLLLGQLADPLAFASLWGLLLLYGFASLLLGPLLTRGEQGVAYGPWLGASHEQVAAVSLALGAAALLALAWTARRAPAHWRMQVAAMLLVAIGGQLAVAGGRTFTLGAFDLPLASLATAPRYQYLAPAMLAVALCLALSRAAESRRARALGAAALALWALISALPYVQAVRALDTGGYRAARREHRDLVAWIVHEARRHPPGSTVVLPNRRFASAGHLPLEHFPAAAAIFVISFPGDTVEGRRIQFLERDPAALAAARRGRRTRDLLVPPADPSARAPD